MRNSIITLVAWAALTWCVSTQNCEVKLTNSETANLVSWVLEDRNWYAIWDEPLGFSWYCNWKIVYWYNEDNWKVILTENPEYISRIEASLKEGKSLK